MKSVFILFIITIFLAGCSHNPAIFTMGKRTNIGFDPASMSANISWTDGLNVIDVPRENSSFSIEVDEGMGLQFDPTTNTIKGVKKIQRRTGVQVTGYLVELAESNPELAAKYLEHYFNVEKTDIVNDQLRKEIELLKLKIDQHSKVDPVPVK